MRFPDAKTRHDELLKMFRDRTDGRTTIGTIREPSLREVVGHTRSLVRRFQFVPEDLR